MRAPSASSTTATPTRVYGYHLRRSRDAHAAHDLTAETFAQAWLSRARFRDEAGGSAGPWLFGIARHVLLVSVRQRRLERRACERLGVLDAAERASAARARRGLARRPRRGARPPPRGPAAGDPPARRRRPRLRRGRRAPRDLPPGRARTCLARPERPSQASSRFHGDAPDDRARPQLHALGDRLERAAAADLAATRAPPARAAPARVSRRLAVIVAVLAIGVPGVAIAADQLISSDEVAQSMPAGTLALAGTEPTCTVVTKDVEFHCVLAKAPAPRSPTRNPLEGHRRAERRREQARQRRLPLAREDGREWECYIGQAAVDQKIIGQEPPRRVRAGARRGLIRQSGVGRQCVDTGGLTPIVRTTRLQERAPRTTRATM